MKNILKETRDKFGLSQEDLAKKSGVSRQTISAIETGTLTDIMSSTMFKLAIALECDVGDIFFTESVVFTQQTDMNKEG